MTGFSALKDISNAFQEDLLRVSSEWFVAKVGETFEDSVLKKIRDISLFTSKLRLLKAKPLASTPQITEQEKPDISKYHDTVIWTLIEQQTVKSLTQQHAVKGLLVTENSTLDPVLVERKRKIKEQLAKYGEAEMQLHHLYSVLKEKQNEHMVVQAQWDKELGELRDIKASVDDTEEIDSDGPLYRKLHGLVEKMELMRLMMFKLVTRTRSYDWMADPHRRYVALQLSRRANTLEDILRDATL